MTENTHPYIAYFTDPDKLPSSVRVISREVDGAAVAFTMEGGEQALFLYSDATPQRMLTALLEWQGAVFGPLCLLPIPTQVLSNIGVRLLLDYIPCKLTNRKGESREFTARKTGLQ